MGTFMLSSKFFPLVSANQFKHHLCFMILHMLFALLFVVPFLSSFSWSLKIISRHLFLGNLASRKRPRSPEPEEAEPETSKKIRTGEYELPDD